MVAGWLQRLGVQYGGPRGCYSADEVWPVYDRLEVHRYVLTRVGLFPGWLQPLLQLPTLKRVSLE